EEFQLWLLDLFFFQAEDGIRDRTVTGVQTCALPIFPNPQIGGSGSFTVTDNGANDVDPVAGEIRIVNIIAGGTYTITETVAPARSEERRVGKECRSRCGV